MILYHAGEWSGHGGLAELMRRGVPFENVLVSFAFITQGSMQPTDEAIAKFRRYLDSLRVEGTRRVFLDSGAFTAHHQGAAVQLPDLYRAIDVLEPDVYVQLDVIGDADGTRRNLELMRADGYRPLPVFTRGAPFEHLHQLLDEGEDYICLGNISAGRGTAAAMEPWLRQVFKVLHRRRLAEGGLVRTHGFGVTTASVLLDFPFYSVDSAAALKAAAYGTLIERRADGRMRMAKPNARESDAWRHPLATDKGADRARYWWRRKANALAMNQLAQHVTKVWAARGIAWDDAGRFIGNALEARR